MYARPGRPRGPGRPGAGPARRPGADGHDGRQRAPRWPRPSSTAATWPSSCAPCSRRQSPMPADVSYCVVNTNGREYLRACLDAIERVHPPGLEREVLVLDNCSDDGSADMVRAEWPQARLIALDRRTGKAENDSTLLRAATGRHCLLLNEDSELQDGRGGRAGGRAGRRPRRRGGGRAAADQRRRAHRLRLAPARAWAPPWPRRCSPTATWWSRAAASGTRPVGWVQSSAMLVRRARRRAGGLPGPRLLRVLGRDRLLQAPARRRLEGAVRARRRAPSTTTS